MNLRCKFGFHKWHRWDAGHVYGGGFYGGCVQCTRCDLRADNLYKGGFLGRGEPKGRLGYGPDRTT